MVNDRYSNLIANMQIITNYYVCVGLYKSVLDGRCTPCDCDVSGSIRGTSCDPVSGQCECVQGGSGVGGRRCDTCLPGYWKHNNTATSRSTVNITGTYY